MSPAGASAFAVQAGPPNDVPKGSSSSSVALQVYQRQLSKEGLQNVVNKSSGGESGAAGTAAMSAEELRDLFTLRQDTLSDTYDSMCQARDEAVCLDSDKASKAVCATEACLHIAG